MATLCVCVCVCVCVLVSQPYLTQTPWTVLRQAPLSLGFPWQNTGVGGYSLLQGIFLTQGLNLGLLHCRQIFLPYEPLGKPTRTR